MNERGIHFPRLHVSLPSHPGLLRTLLASPEYLLITPVHADYARAQGWDAVSALVDRGVPAPSTEEESQILQVRRRRKGVIIADVLYGS